MSDTQIREILVAHGFKLSGEDARGNPDLKPYVYEAVKAVLAAQTAPVVPEGFKLVDERELLKIKHALESCDAGDYSTGSVIHPSYDEKAVEDALNSVTVMLSAAPSAPIAANSDAKDAARYRWLRSPERGMANLAIVISDDFQPPFFELKCGEELDAAIDHAIAATAQQKESGND